MRAACTAICPACSGVLVETHDSNHRAVWYCPSVIGALEYNETWHRHYLPPGDPHPASATGGYTEETIMRLGLDADMSRERLEGAA